MKRMILAAIAASAGISILTTGCSKLAILKPKETEKPSTVVESVSAITGLSTSGIPARMPGIVVSQGTKEIYKADDRKIRECRVSQGDKVKKGDVLFVYDTDEMKLKIDKGVLEIEKMKQELDGYKKKIETLKKEKQKKGKQNSGSYDIEIKELELDITAQEFQIEQKIKDQASLTESMGDPVVVSPVDGFIKKINASDSSDSDDLADTTSSDAYIIIEEAGNYRIKGKAAGNDLLQRAADPETKVKIISRIDPEKTWEGKLQAEGSDGAAQNNAVVNADDTEDTEDTDTDGENSYFYVSLDNSEGLMMGQHVILEWAESSGNEKKGIPLSSVYLEIHDKDYYCWAESKDGTLERRKLTVGSYYEDEDVYEILSGLELTDYIAVYDESLQEGAAVIHSEDAEEETEEEETEEEVEVGNLGNNSVISKAVSVCSTIQLPFIRRIIVRILSIPTPLLSV